MTTMTTEEMVARRALAHAVERARLAVSRIPDWDTCNAEGLVQADALVTSASGALLAAKAAAHELGQLDLLTDEALMLAANAKLALAMIHEMLAVLCADLDSRRAA